MPSNPRAVDVWLGCSTHGSSAERSTSGSTRCDSHLRRGDGQLQEPPCPLFRPSESAVRFAVPCWPQEMFTVAAFCFQTWLLRVQDLTSGLLAQHLTACSGYCSTPAHISTPALSIWRSHLQTQAGVYKPHAQAWDGTLLTRLLHWTITCSTYFQRPLVCAFCGVFKLGAAADQTHFFQVPPQRQHSTLCCCQCLLGSIHCGHRFMEPLRFL